MRYDISPLWIVIVQFNSSSLRLSSVLHSFIGRVAGIPEASHRIKSSCVHSSVQELLFYSIQQSAINF
ncbi:hypothetical protein MUK42_20732 [Musa troglodytarum]|uniref:Uncharacterized protein n=1 Tax=Musa troglodytarum TaxID=320322 RepID=A0A9E7G2Y3_9LILI|nr:hypothetical protein MUK42_20732 [Musa troglodytarum]